MRDATERLVAKRVKELRESLGLSRYEFARRAGLAVNQVSRIEGLERSPSLSTLARLAEALEVPIGSLLAESTQEPAPKPSSDLSKLTKRLMQFENAKRRSVLRALHAVVDACAEP
jgi:transcriptional regulator with XRE-family HTH domain